MGKKTSKCLQREEQPEQTRFNQLSYYKEKKIVLTFCFAKPGSITNTTPSIVNDVSAMLVDTTTCQKETKTQTTK